MHNLYHLLSFTMKLFFSCSFLFFQLIVIFPLRGKRTCAPSECGDHKHYVGSQSEIAGGWIGGLRVRFLGSKDS
jgi:hypothetical protein